MRPDIWGGIEESLGKEELDSDACLDRLTAMWEDYLALRTTGADGQPGKPGRGKPPTPRTSSLAKQLSTLGDEVIAGAPTLTRVRKMHARARDWLAQLRRRPVARALALGAVSTGRAGPAGGGMVRCSSCWSSSPFWNSAWYSLFVNLPVALRHVSGSLRWALSSFLLF